MQNGLGSSVRVMWNFSPSIVLMISSKTVGNSFIISSGVGIWFPCAGIESTLTVVGFE